MGTKGAETRFQELRARFRGALLRPSEEGHEEARRVWNGAIDRRPSLIARCAGTDDVVEAIRHARAHDGPISVRGGGHSVAGHGVCEGGLMIDLSLMRGVTVDPGQRTARVAGGALLGDLDRATQPFGLATTAGIVSHTGVGGLTLGGGLGHLMRRFGLTVDNLLSVDLVTAEAEQLHVDAETEPELFWGLRGELALDGPDALSLAVTLRLAPPMPFLPAEHYGRPVVGLVVVWTGNLAEGEKVIDGLVGSTESIPTPLSYCGCFAVGGAVSRVDPSATAVGAREAGFELNTVAAWRPQDPDGDRHTAWVRGTWEALRPYSSGVFSHFLSDEGDEGIQAAYGDRLKRLTAIKDRYEPDERVPDESEHPTSRGAAGGPGYS